MLPSHLREIIETTPKLLVRILPNGYNSWINTAMISLEKYTRLEWDWWPLAPPSPTLGAVESLLQREVCVPLLTPKWLYAILNYNS
jgi:hypothetical protein